MLMNAQTLSRPIAEGDRFPDVRKKLELVLDVVRREHCAGRQLSDVLRAVDDLQLPGGVEKAGISGTEIAGGVDRFERRVRPLVVLLQQHRPSHQHFTVFRDPDLDTGRGLSDGVESDPAVGLQADVGAGLGRTVELLQVDSDRAVEAEQVGADRRARGIRNADATHAEHVAQRAVYDQVSDRVERAIEHADRLAVEDLGAAAARDRGEIAKQPALGRRCILHPDHHLRQQILEDARRGEIVAGPDLAQVGHHRVRPIRDS